MTTSALDIVRRALRRTADEAAERGMPPIQLDGQLIRPMLAYAGAASERMNLPETFWKAALAVQLAHEASLVHDDVVDGAATRRGLPTIAARQGVGAALVHGDHLLTAAYRLAAETGSIEFVSLFARAVERTVAGEIAQARSIGRTLDWDEYRSISRGKAGELLGCALAIGAALAEPALHKPAPAEARSDTGRQLGTLYQMLDDLLDYCPRTNTGKPALGDFAQRRWTWPLFEVADASFDDDVVDICKRLRRPSPSGSALRRCLEKFELEAAAVSTQFLRTLTNPAIGQAIVDDWTARARAAVALEEAPISRPGAALVSRTRVGEDSIAYMSMNSKSFRFAARFFRQDDLQLVADVYAFCRVTDDLVDRPAGGDPAALLAEWIDISRNAYDGRQSGIEFLDRAMAEMSSRGVPFTYASELAEGMSMDLRGETYDSLTDLRQYTHRVASVVGQWLTELAGVHDARVLDRAAALGHAMQLTNILRDVGEDTLAGRCYLPADMMRAHGVTHAELDQTCRSGAPISAGYAPLVEELLQAAERDYDLAFSAIPELPRSFQKPVAVAAHVYRGIHAQIRRQAYDNLRQRAVTSRRGKAVLAAQALWQLRSVGSVSLIHGT
ncbi:MAG: squalene/phytoene synthase family protein [Gemmatimonadaceae bacterium]